MSSSPSGSIIALWVCSILSNSFWFAAPEREERESVCVYVVECNCGLRFLGGDLKIKSWNFRFLTSNCGFPIGERERKRFQVQSIGWLLSAGKKGCRGSITNLVLFAIKAFVL